MSATPSEPPSAGRWWQDRDADFAALRAQNEALQQDARRYRLIRDSGEFVVYAVDDGDDGTGVQEIEIPGGALDATVDATPAALQDEQAARLTP